MQLPLGEGAPEERLTHTVQTNGMVRRLGARRWTLLHRLVYVIGPVAVLHFWWMVKRDVTEPAIYAAILTLLLGYRIAAKWRAGRVAARQGVAPT